jgi:hypothetical protein
MPVLIAYAFEAAPGKEKEFEAHLANPAFGAKVCRLIGASRNTLFLKDGKMVRVFEFPDGAKPTPLLEAAKKDAELAAFMRKLGTLVKGGFDYDRPETFLAFNASVQLPLAFDVRP